MAAFAIAGIQAGSGLISGLLGQHTARLHDATDENTAATATVSAFQADLTQIADAFNSGQVSRADAIDALNAVDQKLYSYLRQQVGKTGTAWNTNLPSHCDKTCTVGCCIYNTYYHPQIQKIIGFIQSGSGSIAAGGMKPSKYGFPGLANFTITIKAPPATALGVTGTAGGLVNSVLNAGKGIDAALTGGESLASSTGTLTGGSPNPSNGNLRALAYIVLGVLAFIGLIKLVR